MRRDRFDPFDFRGEHIRFPMPKDIAFEIRSEGGFGLIIGRACSWLIVSTQYMILRGAVGERFDRDRLEWSERDHTSHLINRGQAILDPRTRAILSMEREHEPGFHVVGPVVASKREEGSMYLSLLVLRYEGVVETFGRLIELAKTPPGLPALPPASRLLPEGS